MGSFVATVPLSGGRTVELKTTGAVFTDLAPSEVYEHAIRNNEGVIADTGALMVDTGKFTGRAPDDKYFVKDATTENTIWWGTTNLPTTIDVYNGLAAKMAVWCGNKQLYVRHAWAGADPQYRIGVTVVSTKAYADLFVYNMFINPTADELKNFKSDYTVIHCPEFEADPTVDGVKKPNFAILNLTENCIIIGGTGYTGEIKKGVFSILNYLLPEKHSVMPMHCSANTSDKNDVALFFGLSGTGKTTLSADAERFLIGDDEHGWDHKGVFNFEGGCYAKTINITPESEPEIWNAIKFGAILENTRFFPGTRNVNFADNSVTDNTRVSYPINHIPGAVEPSVGGMPRNIFFLTCDAFGVLPPISKLTPAQAMFHFMSGYTAKVAGTEVGIKEPKTVFSTCFGAPFMPLHPSRYAALLGKKMEENKVNVWLINTGWSGGPYGVGSRMKLRFTRTMIHRALDGSLNNAEYVQDPIFGLAVPTEVAGVPTEILMPKNTWTDKAAYDDKAMQLAHAFMENFKKFQNEATDDILAGAPIAAQSEVSR